MMMKQWLYGLLVVLSLGGTPLLAEEIAGVKVPQSDKVAGSKQELLLNGAGVRYKFIFKIYIGALYLPEKQHAPEAVISSPGPKRILMHFLYDRVEQKDLTEAWREGFEANHPAEALARLKSRIERFSGLFGDAVAGDQIWIDQLPGGDTRVTVNGVEQGTVPGADFYPALLRIWLGDDPVTVELKRALLGETASGS